MPNPPPGGPTDRPRAAPRQTALSRACIVLVRTQGPINLGMVARLCGNLGVSELRLAAPRCRTDDAESLAFATHARELLLSARIFADLAAATADCSLVVGSSGEFRVGELGPPTPPTDLPAMLARRGVGRWALVFGNEADGLDGDELRACQAWIHLDTFGPVTSYNLAHAVAIAGYVIATAEPSLGDPTIRPGLDAANDAAEDPIGIGQMRAADRADVARLAEHWLSALVAAKHPPARDASDFAVRLRALIDRLVLDDRDVRALRGMLTSFERAMAADGDARGHRPPRARYATE